MNDTDILVGGSGAVRRLMEDIELAAQSRSRVLIAGERGVGKQTVARVIHARSARAHAPFISICCAALHERTDVDVQLEGRRSSAADGGTVFLKGIGELNAQMQASLLGWLEARTLRGYGSNSGMLRANIRIIASAEDSLIDRVHDHRFSQDLYYRLNVLYLAVPPLRDRRADIPALLGAVLTKLSIERGRSVPKLAPDARAALLAYHWPGNMRELKDTLERLMMRHEGGAIHLDDLPLEFRHADVEARRA